MNNKVVFNLLITTHAQSKKLAISQCLFHLVPMCSSTGLVWLITGEGCQFDHGNYELRYMKELN